MAARITRLRNRHTWKLKKLGYECIFMAVQKEKHDVVMTGTQDGVEAVNEKELLFAFTSAVTQHGPRSLDALSDDSLRIKVQEYFNEKYRTSLGVRRTQFSKVESGKVRVSGMPVGIPFKAPGSYGRTSKIRILKEAVDLKFEVVEAAPDEFQVVDPIEAPPEHAPPIPGTSDGAEGHFHEGDGMTQQPSSPASSDLDGDVFIHHGDITLEDQSAEAILGAMARGKASLIVDPQIPKPGKRSGKQKMKKNKEEQNTTKASGKQRKKKNKEKRNQTEGKQFQVEHIVRAKKVVGGQLLFQIKWKGYSAKENTWEPEENLPRTLVKKFMKKMKTK